MNMKGQVRALLEQGYTQEQILDYFERSYGQFVLLKPRFQGVDALVWLLPLVALAIGVALVIAKTKRLQNAGNPATRQSGNPDTATGQSSDSYLDQVRNLVSGGKS